MMKSQPSLKNLREKVGGMTVNSANEAYIREALHAVFNADEDLSEDEYGSLCAKYTRLKFMSMSRAGHLYDRYGNLAYFTDELISAAADVLKRRGTMVTFECTNENMFVTCNFEYAYYSVISLIRSCVEDGAEKIFVKLSENKNGVYLFVSSDGSPTVKTDSDAYDFASLYSGTMLSCYSDNKKTAVIKIAPGADPEAEIAVYDTDFLFDRMSPVYMGLGIRL